MPWPAGSCGVAVMMMLVGGRLAAEQTPSKAMRRTQAQIARDDACAVCGYV
jgi:hypothetical protein